MLRQMELPLTFILSPWPIALERAMGTPGGEGEGGLA